MKRIISTILTLIFIIAPTVAYSGALQDEVLRILPNYVGIHETWGANKGPEVNRILKRAGSEPGQPWCMSLVYTVNDDAAKNLGIANPVPRTAGSSIYWKYALNHKLTFKVTTANQVLLGAKVKPASTGIFKVGAVRRDGTFSGHANIVIGQISKKQYRGLDGNTSETDNNLREQFDGGQSAYKVRTLGVPKFLVMGFIEVRE